jgi:hypothetical protein
LDVKEGDTATFGDVLCTSSNMVSSALQNMLILGGMNLLNPCSLTLETGLKDKRGVKKGSKYVKTGRFHIVDNFEDFTEPTKNAIRLSVPMDETFFSFEYRGSGCRVESTRDILSLK